MSEANGATVGNEASGGTAGNANGGSGATAAGQEAGNRAQARIESQQETINQLRAELEKHTAAQREREANDLKAKGRYEELEAGLKAELEAARKKADAWDSYQAEKQAKLLESLSEEDRHLAEGLPLGKLEALVERLAANKQPAGKGAGGNPGGSPTSGQPFTRQQLQRAVTDKAYRDEIGLTWESLQREIASLKA